MKLQKIVNHLQKLHPKEIDLSLDRIKILCEKLGNPQDKIKAISVVGTNGKQSTINAFFSILKEAKVKCNVYTSPHIQKINEMFVFNDNMLHDNELKKNNLPYLVCLTDPTAGGITASYAMLGALHIAESDHALIAFAGKRVIEGTVKESLQEDFQKSSYVQKTGFVDLIVDRKNLKEKLSIILSILLNKNDAITTEENETSENSQPLTKVAS